MKQFKIVSEVSLDQKIDVREVTVDADKYNEFESFISFTAEVNGKDRTYKIPWTRIRLVELVNSV